MFLKLIDKYDYWLQIQNAYNRTFEN